MTPADLRELREALGLTQREMAAAIGLGPTTYHMVEVGTATLRKVHMLAAERVALQVAVEKNNPMLAPASVRREALALAALVTG